MEIKNHQAFDWGSNPNEDQFLDEGLVHKKNVNLPDGSTYTGQWNKHTGLRHGMGVLTRANGSIYEGYWCDDRENGRGRLINSDGDVYDG